MVITVMLHDSCHDFDNGKTDAAFKEHFFLKKAVASGLQKAIGRLTTITSTLRGAGDATEPVPLSVEATSASGRRISEAELVEVCSEYIRFLLEYKYSFNTMLVVTSGDGLNAVDIEEEVDIENDSVSRSILNTLYQRLERNEDLSPEELRADGGEGKYQETLKLELESIDFILGLIDKISTNFGVLHLEDFNDLYNYYFDSLPDPNDETTHKYYFEEVIRIITDDFTATYIKDDHKNFHRKIEDDDMPVSDLLDYNLIEEKMLLYKEEAEEAAAVAEEAEKAAASASPMEADVSAPFTAEAAAEAAAAAAEAAAAEAAAAEAAAAEAAAAAAAEASVSPMEADTSESEDQRRLTEVRVKKGPSMPRTFSSIKTPIAKRDASAGKGLAQAVAAEMKNMERTTTGVLPKRRGPRVKPAKKIPSGSMEMKGGAIEDNVRVIMTKLKTFIDYIVDPGLAGIPIIPDTDTSFIQDDDGENYKENCTELIVEANRQGSEADAAVTAAVGKGAAVIEAAAAAASAQREEARLLIEKSRNIEAALHITLATTEKSQHTLTRFREQINYYKNIKRNIDKVIKVYLKGGYRRDMKGQLSAKVYMDELGGFTILELYEIVNIIKKELPEGTSISEAFSDLRGENYLTNLHTILKSDEMRRHSTTVPPRLTRDAERKLNIYENIKDLMKVEGLDPRALSASESDESGHLDTIAFYQGIGLKINLLESYNKYYSKIIDFLDGQKMFYGSSPKTLTQTEKTRRSDIFTEILNHYKSGFGEEITNIDEWKRLYPHHGALPGAPPGAPRSSGSTLDSRLWKDSFHPTNLPSEDFREYLEAHLLRGGKRFYINNAIPSRCAKILAELGFTPWCFTSVIDPMGAFGDCYPVPNPNISGPIEIEIKVDDDNCLLIHLMVSPKRYTSLTGSVKIIMKGVTLLDEENIDINNFQNSKPLSIANTVKLFQEGNTGHNVKQIVRKFLGDFLQGIEAINQGILYLSGDKPATVMYYLLNALSGGAGNLGGYVEKGPPCMIYTHNNSILTNIFGSPLGGVVFRAGRGGGSGQLKDKKKIRKSQKRRTNPKNKTKRRKRTNKRKTSKRRSVRRKTSKRRSVRRNTSKRRSVRRKK